MRSVLLVAMLGSVASADVPPCAKERAHCFGIRLHVARKGDELVVTQDWIATMMGQANRHFAALDVGWELASVDAIDEKFARIATRKDRDALAKLGLGKQVVDVFVTGRLDDIDVEGNVALGVTWRAGDRKFIILGTDAWLRTLAHELGHFFGLPHSTYAISIMNKAERKDPPLEERTFADEEIAAMKPFLKTKTLAERAH